MGDGWAFAKCTIFLLKGNGNLRRSSPISLQKIIWISEEFNISALAFFCCFYLTMKGIVMYGSTCARCSGTIEVYLVSGDEPQNSALLSVLRRAPRFGGYCQ